MNWREHFRLPTRVSRLYPLLALGFLFTTGALFYSWQYTQINSDSAVKERDAEIEQLKTQVGSLLSQQKDDQKTLDIQQKKIDATTVQLQSLEAELKSKSDDLAKSEAQLQQTQQQITDQQAQLSKNADELNKLRSHPPLFSFQNKSSHLQNVDQKEADIKQVVTDAYNYWSQVYGDPYLLDSITITFVDSFSIAGAAGEIVISNGPNGLTMDIHLKDFDKSKFDDDNTLIHEMGHARHGYAALGSSAFEEGMNVAATDVVMAMMIADGKLPAFRPLYLTINDSQYNVWNSTLRVAEDSSTFYSDPNVSKVYQLIGTAWMRFYNEDHDFFKKLNAAYYPKVQKGLTPDDAMIKDAIRSIVPSVKGQPIDQYLANNRAFNPS